MAEDDQNEEGSSGEEGEQGGQSAPKQGGNSGLKKGIMIGGLFLMFILMIALLATIRFDPGDQPPDYFATGSTSCGLWSNAPFDYQNKIEAAANTVGIQPALLGAIFMTEHNDGWEDELNKDHKLNGPWKTSPTGAEGPFQIIKFQEYWDKYVNETSKIFKFTPNPKPDSQNFEDSALLAASYLYVLSIREVGNINPKTTNENEIKCLATAYNKGPELCREWKKRNYADPQPKTEKEYHNRAWKHFQELYVNCSNGFIQKIQNSWLTSTSYSASQKKEIPDVKGKMEISGVVLHWTAGNDVKSAIGAMTNSHSYVHLIIDKEGKVFQLLPLDSRVRSGSGDGNSFAVGIEIVSIASDSIDKNEEVLLSKDRNAQFNAVVETIKYLADTYGVRVKEGKNVNVIMQRGNTENLINKEGIFGHYQVQGVYPPVKENDKLTSWPKPYIRGCQGAKSDPGKEYMKKVWDTLKLDGNGC